MPQISADLLAHLDAVTRVELAADDGVVLQAEVLLRHVGVALEAARRDDHAAQRAHVAGLAVARDLHADHDAAVRILNQLDGRGLEPHVDLVRALDDRVLHRLIQEAVAHALMGGAQRDLVAALKFRIFRAHLADDRHARPVHELGIVAVEELILEFIPHVGHAVNDDVEHGLRHGAPARQLGVISHRGLAVLMAVGEQLTGHLGVAARQRFAHLFGDEHLCARVRGGDGGGHAGKAETQHHDVIFRIPLHGIGKCISAAAFGDGCARAAHRGENAHRGAALEEVTTRDVLHCNHPFT